MVQMVIKQLPFQQIVQKFCFMLKIMRIYIREINTLERGNAYLNKKTTTAKKKKPGYLYFFMQY